MDISFGMILYAVVYVASMGVTIMWLKSDLKKHEAKHTEYVESHGLVTKDVKDSINELFDRTNKTMTRTEITSLVKECIGVLKEDTGATKRSMEKISDTVTSIKEDFIRIDERYKAHTEHNSDRRTTD